jgi:Tfp pilus assembly protein PilO
MANPEMERPSVNQRERILVAACAIVVVVFGAPVALDAMNAGPSADQKIASLKSQKADKLDEAANLDKRVNALKPKVDALAYNVSSYQLSQTMIRRLSELAQSTGVTLVTARPIKPRDLDVMTEVSVELHVSTDLSNLVKFLYPLQQPDSKFTVDRLRLSATTSGESSLDADVTISSYTMQSDAAPTKATSRSSA